MDHISFRTRAARARAGQQPANNRPVNPAYVDRYEEDHDFEDGSGSDYISDGEEYFDAPEAAPVAHGVDSTAISEPPGRPAVVQGIIPQTSHNLAAPAVVRDAQTHRGRVFARCTFSRGPPPFIDLTRLEFYQIFPHDAAATLCKMHFLSLARAWIRRREGSTEADLQRLAKTFPHAHSDHQLDRARNLTTLSQAIARDKWRQTPITTFVQDVARKIDNAEQLLREERRKIIAKTGQPPLCGLGGGKQILVCGYCAAMKRPTENLYRVLQQARDKIPHGNFHRADMPAISEFKTKPRPAKETKLPSAMALSPENAYVSVGGLHFVVDVCNKRTHIKMQNTNMALPMSQGYWNFGAGLLQKHLCELPNAFDLASCRLNKNYCLCRKPDLYVEEGWRGRDSGGKL